MTFIAVGSSFHPFENPHGTIPSIKYCSLILKWKWLVLRYVMPIKRIRELRVSAYLLIYLSLFFKLLLGFGLDFELGLTLGLEFGLGLGLGLGLE